MQSILVVAINTFRETLRDKLFYNLIVFGVMLIGASVVLGGLTISEQSKIVTDMGLASINLVGVIVAVFVGIGLVTKEIERRTIYTVLARPIGRSQFLLGKFLGLVLTITANVGIMVAMFMVTLWWNHVALSETIFQAVELILVETWLVTAVALLVSAFSSATLSAIVTLSVYVTGHLTGDLMAMAEKSHNELVSMLMKSIYYICPNLELFNLKGQAAYAIPVEASYVLASTAYGMAYAGFFLAMACLVLERRDF